VFFAGSAVNKLQAFSVLSFGFVFELAMSNRYELIDESARYPKFLSIFNVVANILTRGALNALILPTKLSKIFVARSIL